jgi:hypothetical protein
VLVNLISNGVKFTERGAVSLTAYRDDDGAVRFCVADTGIGFDEGEKARIFERFQQADASITRRFGGSGLGLSISRELVALMGGELDCDSRPREGAQFWFSLPLPRTTPPRPASAPTPIRLRANARSASCWPTTIRPTADRRADAGRRRRGGQCREWPRGRAGLPRRLADRRRVDGRADAGDGRPVGRARDPPHRGRAGKRPRPDHHADRQRRRRTCPASRGAGADLHIEKPITSAMLFAAIGQAFEAAQDVPETLAAEA